MSKAKPYHKENLRGDLLVAGREYIEMNGHIGLSIRTLAQQVGVSPGAPYHHFPDRRSFLLAIAIEGFHELMTATAAIADANQNAARKLKRMGMAFIRFVEENPRLVDLMYESELTMPVLDPELLKFQVMGHQALKRPIQAALPDIPDAEAEVRVITFWSAIYGFASMRKKGVLHPTEPGAVPTVDIAEAVVDRLVVSALAP
ncbi:TetR/AcrR family transcriptional regulator [Telluria mixta]|uniref:TetR/AcrR family transcriptional regulator n=1 Tax=Telluria mixta TaxID=34071 RepID=A0ABT2BYK6_9BURK|nr:TetR/AcrR family transcriptional regulator [Telluria mixta]MCS0630221.1 TetR/AcrR family transcriptional regulator [Telluria mixta]WEM94471.1 TetR/AcrR family transcriptional regulator [Telluria mixta]